MNGINSRFSLFGGGGNGNRTQRYSPSSGSTGVLRRVESKEDVPDKKPVHMCIDDDSSENEPEKQPTRPRPADATRYSSEDADTTIDMLLLHPTNQSKDSEQGDEQRKKAVWDVYMKQKERYQKHKRLADQASEEMGRAATVLFRLTGSQTPLEPADYDDNPTKVPRTSPEPKHRKRKEPSSPPASQPKQGPEVAPAIKKKKKKKVDQSLPKEKDQGDDGCVMASGVLSPRPTSHSVSSLLKSRHNSKPYQFTTSYEKAFELKPRGAFTCTFGEPNNWECVVAYGLDGTVQLWNPWKQRRDAAIFRENLRIKNMEHMAQISPYILAGVPNYAADDHRQPSRASIVFLGVGRSTQQRSSSEIACVKHWSRSSQHSPISVVAGITNGQGYGPSDRAYMVTGGVSSKGLDIWSLETVGPRVNDVTGHTFIDTGHKSRITALCHEPVRNCILSGSQSGNLTISDAIKGKSAHNMRYTSDTVASLSICPTDSNLALVTYVSKQDQIQILDLRQRASGKPALTLGINTYGTQSRYVNPTWHTDGNLIFYPFRRMEEESTDDGYVAIWDTRYVRCNKEAPQKFQPHKKPVWSICFSKYRRQGMTMAVTASGDHSMGFTTFRL